MKKFFTLTGVISTHIFPLHHFLSPLTERAPATAVSAVQRVVRALGNPAGHAINWAIGANPFQNCDCLGMAARLQSHDEFYHCPACSQKLANGFSRSGEAGWWIVNFPLQIVRIFVINWPYDESSSPPKDTRPFEPQRFTRRAGSLEMSCKVEVGQYIQNRHIQTQLIYFWILSPPRRHVARRSHATIIVQVFEK